MNKEQLIQFIRTALDTEFDKFKVDKTVEVNDEEFEIRVPKTLDDDDPNLRLNDPKEYILRSAPLGEDQLFTTISRSVALPFIDYLDANTIRLGEPIQTGGRKLITAEYLRAYTPGNGTGPGASVWTLKSSEVDSGIVVEHNDEVTFIGGDNITLERVGRTITIHGMDVGEAVPPSRTLTIQGVSERTLVVPSSVQDLTEDRSWTISLPDTVTINNLIVDAGNLNNHMNDLSRHFKFTMSNTAPSQPGLGDLWLDTSGV